MIIKHGCVILRAIEEKDFELLFSMINSPEIDLQTGAVRIPVSEAEQHEWIKSYRNSDQCIRLIIEVASGDSIGMITLNNIDWRNRTAFLHYKIDPDAKGRVKGDVFDAVCGVLSYAFLQMGLNCIEGTILTDNIFSRKLAKKVGFIEEGIMRQRLYFNGRYHDQISISILRSEFIA